jgi:hypothetical protein
VQVGVADTAKQDVDLNIVRPGFAALERKWLERRSGGMGYLTDSLCASLLLYRPFGVRTSTVLAIDKFPRMIERIFVG